MSRIGSAPISCGAEKIISITLGASGEPAAPMFYIKSKNEVYHEQKQIKSQSVGTS